MVNKKSNLDYKTKIADLPSGLTKEDAEIAQLIQNEELNYFGGDDGAINMMINPNVNSNSNSNFDNLKNILSNHFFWILVVLFYIKTLPQLNELIISIPFVNNYRHNPFIINLIGCILLGLIYFFYKG